MPDKFVLEIKGLLSQLECDILYYKSRKLYIDASACALKRNTLKEVLKIYDRNFPK
jgi:hypothetical protein